MTNALALSDAERRVAERIDPKTMGSLAVSAQAGGVVFANADEVMNFAKMMAVASGGVRKHLRGNPGACLAIVTQAVEWGMSPFAVANKSYFVNDQVAFESQLVQAVILKRAPIKGRIKFDFSGTGDKRVCRAWARLADDPEEIVEYISPEFGKITPKNSPLWKSDPDQQHAYYAGRALCRRHFPDVLLGVYTDDELPAPPPGPERARDVTPKGLGAKLDALAAGPASKDLDPAADPDPEPDLPEVDANDGADDPEPAIDPQNPDFQRGATDRKAGQKRCAIAAIRDSEERFAAWKAGFDSVADEGDDALQQMGA